MESGKKPPHAAYPAQTENRNKLIGNSVIFGVCAVGVLGLLTLPQSITGASQADVTIASFALGSAGASVVPRILSSLRRSL
jgi:hypothetical protein